MITKSIWLFPKTSHDDALGDAALALERPPVVGLANHADVGIASIESEAGFSAWLTTTIPMNLALAKSAYRTVEAETVDYIIGSVPVAGYHESADVHVYAHRDGWILGYYKSSDPISKIVDTVNRSLATTKLSSAVASVAAAAGVGFTGVSYYDFRYPNATHAVMIVEQYDSGDNSFTIQLPSTYAYFERGWAHQFNGANVPYYLRLDGAGLSGNSSSSDMGGNRYGTVTASQLAPDTEHLIEVKEWGVLIILYRVP